jgi:allantoin racemase
MKGASLRTRRARVRRLPAATSSRSAPFLADLYGYERQYVGCHSIAVPVLKIHDDVAKVQADLGEAALRLIEDKQAAAILLGCTGFLGCAEAIRKRLAAAGHFIPVIDPVPTTVSIAAALVRNGLAHSQISYPPFDAAKQIVGFETFFNQR